MVGGYELSLVIPEGTPPEVVQEYFELVREKERAVDEKWGGRPLSERRRYFELDEPTTQPRLISEWLEPGLLNILDEDRIDALFQPTDCNDPVIYDRENIATLLNLFREAKDDFVASSRKQHPELSYEGTYIALLEFALEHEDFGVSIPM